MTAYVCLFFGCSTACGVLGPGIRLEPLPQQCRSLQPTVLGQGSNLRPGVADTTDPVSATEGTPSLTFYYLFSVRFLFLVLCGFFGGPSCGLLGCFLWFHLDLFASSWGMSLSIVFLVVLCVLQYTCDWQQWTGIVLPFWGWYGNLFSIRFLCSPCF